jgi:soluble P-type ATPase
MGGRVIEALEAELGPPPDRTDRTAETKLPGAPAGDVDAFHRERARRFTQAGVPTAAIERLCWLYGRQLDELLDLGAADPTWLRPLGEGLPALRGEVKLAVEREMALTLSDFMDRRAALLLFIARLRGMGLSVAMVTGDQESTARAVAREVGIDDVVAGVLPEGKLDAIESRQARGEIVAMVGDGINDAPAMARADLGLAMGSGTDIAIEAGDITLMRPDLHAVADAIELSRATVRTMYQNLFWAFAYNVVGIPIAAGALYPLLGLQLSPVMASAAMAASSVSVVANSLRLRRWRLRSLEAA